MIKNKYDLHVNRYRSDSHPEFKNMLFEVSSGLFTEINGYGGTDDDAIEDFCAKLDVLWPTTH